MKEQSANGSIVIERNLLIPLSDGSTLCADLYRPDGPGPFPALLSFYPYHKDDMIGAMNEAPRRYFAENGYACLLIDFRGLGGSSGVVWEAMDRREGIDGAEAVEWIARQKWCDGNVGMWGLSYGGISSLKVAAERPPHLKAIIPMQGTVDIYHDYLHPGGCRSCLGSFGAWGSFMLALNLMPPTNTDAEGRWYRVWMERLEKSAPYVLPWLDHPAHDEYWSSRAVDPAKITTPTFIIGSWRDIFPEGMAAIYPKLGGPKKLLMGPWMHGLPDTSAFEPIDFLPHAKRWFDYWVKGEKNGAAEEPPVTIHVQNANQWRHEREWPIARARNEKMFLGAGGVLRNSPDREEQGENYRADPTVGTAAGLWDPMALGVGLPLDQSEDDLRSLTFTSEPIRDDAEISGPAEAALYAAITSGSDANLVAKLCDVDPNGGSSLITTGWLKASHRESSERPRPPRIGEAQEYRIALWSTSYRVPKGHRIRLSISCSDFPRIWPDPVKPEIRVFFGGNRASSVSIPVVPAAPPIKGAEITKPAVNRYTNVLPAEPIWKIERDLAAGAVAVTTGEKARFVLPQGGTMEVDHVVVARTTEARPDTASVHGDTTMRVRIEKVGNLEIHTNSWVTQSGMTLNAKVTMDGTQVFEKRWIK